jgi:hypothetical protein
MTLSPMQQPQTLGTMLENGYENTNDTPVLLAGVHPLPFFTNMFLKEQVSPINNTDAKHRGQLLEI